MDDELLLQAAIAEVHAKILLVAPPDASAPLPLALVSDQIVVSRNALIDVETATFDTRWVDEFAIEDFESDASFEKSVDAMAVHDAGAFAAFTSWVDLCQSSVIALVAANSRVPSTTQY